MTTLISSISTVVGLSHGAADRTVLKKLSLSAIVLITLVLSAFGGLRFRVGSDYSMYAYFFENVDPDSLNNSLETVPQEFGFVLLMMVCRSLSDDTRFFFTVAAVITVFTALVAIRRLSVHPTFSVFLYFFLTYYTLSLNAVRQSIAVSFLMLGESYRESSKVRWVFFSVVAMAFHTSTVIAFIVQICITRWKPRPLSSIILLIVGVPVGLVLINSGPGRSWLSTLNPRYEEYFASDGGGIGTILILVVRITVIIWALFELNRRFDAQASKYLAMVIVSAFALMLGLSSWVFARFEPFFGIYLVFLIPVLIHGKKHENAVRFLISVSVLVYFGVHVANFNGLLPYQTDAH